MSSKSSTGRYDANRALQLLRAGTGMDDARFREGQEEAIQAVVEGVKRRLLIVQRTGWGKSFVYFIATKLLRESGDGPCLLISPLLALMRNQIAAAKRMGLRAETINSENQAEWERIAEAVRRDEVDVLLISPERLANPDFRANVLSEVSRRIGLLVVDEAHCISDWGHDFRPHYRRIERIIRALPPNLRVLATTATANNRVMQDLQEVLGPDLFVSRGDLNRPSLTLQTIRLPSQAERMAWLADQMPRLNGSGIVYTLTVRDAELLTAWLRACGLNVATYTAETDAEARPMLEEALLKNELKALVATVALGMGFDKPDLAFVIHFQSPGSVVAYYQQVGRAGRALNAAYGVLLSGEEDEEITDYFIRSAFPTHQEVEAVLSALEASPEGLTLYELLGKVNIPQGRLKKTLELLELESPAPITKTGSKYQLTPSQLSEAFWQRAQLLTDLRYQEQHQMQEYAALTSGHMQFLIQALDGDPTKVGEPTLPPLPTQPPENLVRQAIAFLRRTSLPIDPRERWPHGGMPQYQLTGTIKPEHMAEPGKALCRWGDAGWGRLVRQGKYQDGRFSDELVQACVTLVREWNPRPSPKWVTAIPSLRHPDLVPDFAQRLAKALGLPYYSVLRRTEARPEQKTMANTIQQARNVDGALALQGSPLRSAPVILIDDMVDSRWTFTVAAWLLRSHGSGPVFPLALAMTSKAEILQ